MLVIKRKKGESFVIGEDIEVTVVDVENGAVKIAVKAPKEVIILRKELIEEVESENKKAIEINEDMIKKLKNK